MAEETLLTNRELAKWLAQGNGELRDIAIDDSDEIEFSRTNHTYCLNSESQSVSSEIMIRKWCDVEWHKPTKEYIAPKGD